MSVLWNLEHIRPEPGIVVPGETIPEMFRNAVARRGEAVFMREKELGIWRSWSWNETGRAVRETAMGLAALGFRPGECASILSNTVVEWVIADLGVLCAGGVANGIYPTDAASQVHYLCEDSRTTVVFVEDDEQLDKVLEVRDRLPLLRHIVVFDMDGLRHFEDPMVTSLEALRRLGADHDAAHPGEYDARCNAAGPGDLAILIYTSGTTGRPKGAMLSHANVVYTTRGYNLVISQTDQDERMCFLPLCHVAERLGGEYFALYTGARLNFVENPDTVPENVREIAPTVFIAVPRVWEKFYSAVSIAISEATRLQQLAYRWGIGVGRRVAQRVLEGKPVPATLKAAFRIARVLALDNVRKMIGIHRARYLVTGAAPISPELVRWYLSLGVPMLEVWGQTESGGASTGMPATRIKPGSIGPAAAYNEVRLDPATGELLIRGPNVFMGYLNQPEKTAEAIDADGWLHTGDVVREEDGQLRIVDRLKDIMITAGGKNLTPSEIENTMKASPFIRECIVIADGRRFASALVQIDFETGAKWAESQRIAFTHFRSLAENPRVRELIESEIARGNAQLAPVAQVRRFHLLTKELDHDEGEVTATMKVRRASIYQAYAAEIEALYR